MSSLPQAGRVLRPPAEIIDLFNMVDTAFVGDQEAPPSVLRWAESYRSFNESVPHAVDPELVLSANGILSSNEQYGVRIRKVELRLDTGGTECRATIVQKDMHTYNLKADTYLRIFSDSLKSHLRGLQKA